MNTKEIKRLIETMEFTLVLLRKEIEKEEEIPVIEDNTIV